MHKEKELYQLLRDCIINNKTPNLMNTLSIHKIQESLADSKLREVSRKSGVCQEAIRNVFKSPVKVQLKTLRKLTEYIYKRNNIV